MSRVSQKMLTIPGVEIEKPKRLSQASDGSLVSLDVQDHATNSKVALPVIGPEASFIIPTKGIAGKPNLKRNVTSPITTGNRGSKGRETAVGSKSVMFR